MICFKYFSAFDGNFSSIFFHQLFPTNPSGNGCNLDVSFPTACLEAQNLQIFSNI